MNFRVGMRVVLMPRRMWHVEGRKGAGRDYGFQEGSVYTVSAINQARDSLQFHEIESGNTFFYADCFRPAVEPDISVFTAMLSKTPRDNERAAKRLREKEAA